MQLARLVLVLLVFSPFISTDALKYVRYRWRFIQDGCVPITKFDFVTEHCTDSVNILGTTTRCVCNHTTNEVMMITATWDMLYPNGSATNYSDTVTERYFLGACYQQKTPRVEQVIYLADTKDVCGPTIEDVIAHGKPFEAGSYDAFRPLSSPAWAQSSLAPVLVASLPLMFLMLFISKN